MPEPQANLTTWTQQQLGRCTNEEAARELKRRLDVASERKSAYFELAVYGYLSVMVAECNVEWAAPRRGKGGTYDFQVVDDCCVEAKLIDFLGVHKRGLSAGNESNIDHIVGCLNTIQHRTRVSFRPNRSPAVWAATASCNGLGAEVRKLLDHSPSKGSQWEFAWSNGWKYRRAGAKVTQDGILEALFTLGIGSTGAMPGQIIATRSGNCGAFWTADVVPPLAKRLGKEARKYGNDDPDLPLILAVGLGSEYCHAVSDLEGLVNEAAVSSKVSAFLFAPHYSVHRVVAGEQRWYLLANPRSHSQYRGALAPP